MAEDDALLDAVGMVVALARNDTRMAEAAVSLGDGTEMLWRLAALLADALRDLPDEDSERVVAGWRHSGWRQLGQRPGVQHGDYGPRPGLDEDDLESCPPSNASPESPGPVLQMLGLGTEGTSARVAGRQPLTGARCTPANAAALATASVHSGS